MKNAPLILLGFTLFSIISCTKESGSNPTPPVVEEVNPPAITILSIPANNSTCEQGFTLNSDESSVSFSWEDAANTDNYEIVVTNIDSQVQINKSNISGNSTTVTLQKGMPYSWKIISKSLETSATASSELWKFYLAGAGITNYAPFPPTLISPVSGLAVVPNAQGKITLSWEGNDVDGDALLYTVFLDTVDGFQTPPQEYQQIASTSLEVDVTADTVYYWRISATDTNNTTASIVYTFRVQ